MEKKYILAHDIGTGGDKAVLTDLKGRIVQSAYQGYPVYYPRPEWAEQNPEELWQAFAATTRAVIQQAGIHSAEIFGVGISAQMFNLLPVDEHCSPVMPMISWLDVRSVPQADRVLSGDISRFVYEVTGNIPTAKDTIPKILWLKEERPDLWARTAKLLDCKEYLLFRLTGRLAIDFHGASAFFLFDAHHKRWSEDVCQRLGIPIERLPDAYPCTELIGEVRPQAGSETGLEPGTPVVICAGDVAMAQSGAGANRAGMAHLCIGTATWIGISTQMLVNDPQKPFWALQHLDPHKWIIAGEMETGGGALMWFRDVFCQEEVRLAGAAGISAYQLLEHMARLVPPGAEKLLFTPWLSGERAPVLDHYARAGFIGLSMGHSRPHLARAVMEGVAYHLRWIIAALEKLGLPVGDLQTIGGGSTSPVWTQIIADVTNRHLKIVANPQEAGAVGTALTVAVGLGISPSVDASDDLVEISRVVEPDPANRQRYDDLFGEYCEVYEALAPIYRRLYEVK